MAVVIVLLGLDTVERGVRYAGCDYGDGGE